MGDGEDGVGLYSNAIHSGLRTSTSALPESLLEMESFRTHLDLLNLNLWTWAPTTHFNAHESLRMTVLNYKIASWHQPKVGGWGRVSQSLPLQEDIVATKRSLAIETPANTDTALTTCWPLFQLLEMS